MLLVVWPGAPSSVLAPSSDALVPSSFLLLVVWPGAPSSVLAASSDALAPSSFLLLVVWSGAPSNVLAPSDSNYGTQRHRSWGHASTAHLSTSMDMTCRSYDQLLCPLVNRGRNSPF